MSEVYDQYREAMNRAKASVKLLDYLQSQGLETRGRSATCPWCFKKGKLYIRDNSANCFSSGCIGNKSMDHINFMMEWKGWNFRTAADALLESANIRNPFHS